MCSPDGQQVVFRGGLEKSKREPGFDEELYLIRTGGSGLQQLTHYPPADTACDQTFKLWNLDNGRCTLTFHGYQETIYSTQFLSER